MTKRTSNFKTWHTPINKCLACDYQIDAVTKLAGSNPKPGDISVCLMCGHLMGFNKDMTVRELTSDEIYEAAGDKRILAIQAARALVLGRPK